MIPQIGYNYAKFILNKEVSKNMAKESRQFILVTNPNMVDELESMGFKGLLQTINSQKLYSFQVTDKLYKFLKKSKFTKQDYQYDSKLRF